MSWNVFPTSESSFSYFQLLGVKLISRSLKVKSDNRPRGGAEETLEGATHLSERHILLMFEPYLIIIAARFHAVQICHYRGFGKW